MKLAEMCVMVPLYALDFVVATIKSWERDPERCIASGKQIIEVLRQSSVVRLSHFRYSYFGMLSN